MGFSGADLQQARMLEKAGREGVTGSDGALLAQLDLQTPDDSGSGTGFIVDDPAYEGIQFYVGSELPSATPELYENCAYLVLPPYTPTAVLPPVE